MGYSKYPFPAGYKNPAQPYSRFGYNDGLWVPAKIGRSFGLLPSGSGNPTPPAIFLAGQSNAGNQDEIPGTINAGVTLYWSNNAIFPTINGPIAMSLQAGGHSFEMQCSANVASQYNKPITVGKYWVDGSVIDLWKPEGLAFSQMCFVLEKLARDCVSTGVSQVEVLWSQGESNTRNDLASLLPTFESDTSAVFDGISTFLAAYGLTTHFTIIKTNANIVTGVNPTDPGVAGLAAVRGFQENLALVRADTSIVNFDFMVPAVGGGVHYAHGQTNIGGAIIAQDIILRYSGSQPAFTAPLSIETILSGSIVFDYDTRAIVGLNNNDPIAAWPDIGPGGHNLAPVGAARPLYKTNALGTIPEALFDGVDDTAIVPGVSLVAPGATPIFSMMVVSQKTWTLNDRLFGASSNFTFSLYQSTTSPKLGASAGSAGVDFNGLPLATYGKVENYFSNAASDYIQCIDVRTTTNTLGNSPPGIVAMAQTNNSGFGNIGVVRWILGSSKPNTSQRNQLRGYGSVNYGLSVWGGI